MKSSLKRSRLVTTRAGLHSFFTPAPDTGHMSDSFFGVPRSRRAALAGGAALLLTAAAVHAVSAQQTAAEADATDIAAPPSPDLQDITFVTGGAGAPGADLT